MQTAVSGNFQAGERLRRWRWNGHDCRGDLRNSVPLLGAMLAGVAASGASVRSQTVEKFLPHGVTLVLVLSESHFVVSTWPEFSFASIDVAVCSDSVDIERLCQPLVSLLAAAECDSDLQATLMRRLQRESKVLE